MKGNKIIDGKSDFNFSCSKPMVYVYVGGCSTETTSTGIVSFCDNQNIKIESIDELNSRNKFKKSFKIAINNYDRDTVLNEDFWPLGIVFRRFFHPKSTNRSSSR